MSHRFAQFPPCYSHNHTFQSTPELRSLLLLPARIILTTLLALFSRTDPPPLIPQIHHTLRPRKRALIHLDQGLLALQFVAARGTEDANAVFTCAGGGDGWAKVRFDGEVATAVIWCG
jgi:hypothetical protein